MLGGNKAFHALLAYKESQRLWESISDVQTTWD